MKKLNFKYLLMFLLLFYVIANCSLLNYEKLNAGSIEQEIIILEDVRFNDIPAIIEKSKLLTLLGEPDQEIYSSESVTQLYNGGIYSDEVERIYWFYDEPMIGFFIIDEIAYFNHFIFSSDDYMTYGELIFDHNTEYFTFESIFPAAYGNRFVETEDEVFAISVMTNYSNTSVIRFNFENNKLTSVDLYP